MYMKSHPLFKDKLNKTDICKTIDARVDMILFAAAADPENTRSACTSAAKSSQLH